MLDMKSNKPNTYYLFSNSPVGKVEGKWMIYMHVLIVLWTKLMTFWSGVHWFNHWATNVYSFIHICRCNVAYSFMQDLTCLHIRTFQIVMRISLCYNLTNIFLEYTLFIQYALPSIHAKNWFNENSHITNE